MKKWSMILAVILMITTVLAACGGKTDQASGNKDSNKESEGSKDKSYTIKVANYYAIDHPQNVALQEKFKPLVEEKSGGSLKVEIYENNKLGGEKEFYTGVRNGTIEMGIPGMIMQADVPKMGVVERPFLLRDFKHAKEVLNGPIGKEMTDELEKVHGVHALAWSANGFRMVSSNREVASMKDFKGLRLRMPNTPVFVELGQALGANVSPMPLSEVFTAMEQKVVDGQDNPIGVVKSSGFYEVQSHILESRHGFTPNVLIVNQAFWKKLSPNQKKAVEEAAKEYADYEWKLSEESYESDKKFLQGKGMKFVTPDEKFMSEMEKAVQPMYESYYKEFPWAKEMVEKIKQQGK
ncbi:TRAP transporter substrate-binding protein [Neobacillus rhizophilus]|uniref:DctP family TRAP transporter solute-binding subunit n=1 Tax=Neobacillus rhizophilus TaxID=2833579 RepID=A0A942U5H0_9BACI|nr:TRAP transporter substrate-binding protein [Neobacillus rhizophilus]MBS4212792.1 DctP family TRAP transporter solute-binding subunit [Neobacillus rhizophilus]MBU8915223.1 DctP family TRAP transporter solute-binding subunit [Bacillus sp. FJAT-29953]